MTSHNEAQKTKADWLRSEIEKLDGMRLPEQSDYHTSDLIYTSSTGLKLERNKGNNQALTSIITRYKEELKALETHNDFQK